MSRLHFIGYLLLAAIFSSCDRIFHTDHPTAYHIQIFKDTRAEGLAYAIRDGDTNEIKEIIATDRSLLRFQEPRFGTTPLLWAFNMDEIGAAAVLLKLGADPEQTDFSGESPFLRSAGVQSGSSYLQLCLRYHPEINRVYTDDVGAKRTAAIVACMTSLENTKILVEAGADVHTNVGSSPDISNPLTVACVHEDIEIIRYLVVDCHVNFRQPLMTTIQDDTLYITTFLRDMNFDLNSDEYKQKKLLVKYLKERGVDYASEPVPERILRNYPPEYIEVY